MISLRQREPEVAAALDGLDVDLSTLGFDRPACDRQAEPATRFRFVRPLERFEDHAQLVSRNTAALIAHMKLDLARMVLDLERHRARIRVLDRVVDQVLDRGPCEVRIGAQLDCGIELGLELEALVSWLVSESFRRIPE